jgi:hypothetical protein
VTHGESASLAPVLHVLPVIDYHERGPIELFEIPEPIWGWPIADQQPERLRELTFENCARLARASSPVANQIETHRTWLASSCETPAVLLAAMECQAAHERNLHAATALEGYLNLVDIYAQQPIFEQAFAIFVDADASLRKLQSAGFGMESDPAELEREKIKLEQQVAELRYSQSRLQDGLEGLLHLAPQSGQPIWTRYVAREVGELGGIEDFDQAREVAFANRGDLQALMLLASDCSMISNETLTRLVASAQPMLGPGLVKSAVARWWQCALKDELERLEAQESAARRRQLNQLIEAKRQMIAGEVQEILHSLRRHRELAELKHRELESLQDSIAAAEKAKDERPLDFAKYQQQRLRALELTGQIVHEVIAIDIDQIRLRRAQGLWGR